ncbi:MAG TPA: hypothetical protein VGS09_00425 [Actinomycetota bacterium]|jgi:hypothetical protein|nr:hypothetical protein [Actinomycetota bacterium]
MRARVLFAGLVAISTVVTAGPASAKASVAEANITGPGLGGGLRIEAPDTEGLWESGIDVAGGLDDTRADSVEELGRTPADLGPRYLVTYRFDFSDVLIRQDLYPYAKGGPVTYTPPGQELTAGVNMPITAGWYQSSLGFFHYLVKHGLPETNPVASVATRERAPDTAPGAQTAPWAGIVVVLVGLAALSLAAVAVRRRVLVGGRVNR